MDAQTPANAGLAVAEQVAWAGIANTLLTGAMTVIMWRIRKEIADVRTYVAENYVSKQDYRAERTPTAPPTPPAGSITWTPPAGRYPRGGNTP